MKSIALIDDDKSIRDVVSAYLHRAGYDCVAYAHPLAFTEDLKQQRRQFDLAITDVNMPRVTGLELVTWLKRYYPGMCTIALTAHASEEIESIAYQGGACLFLKKPLKMAQLHRTIRLLSQEGLSGEVFQVTLIDCLQSLACDSNPRVLKIQEDGRSYLLLALQNNLLQGLLYVGQNVQLQGMDALEKLTCIGDATFSELDASTAKELIHQALNIPLPQVALHIAQYQDESSFRPIKAQTLGIYGPPSQKALLAQILSNMGFEISENPEVCHAHIVMASTPDAFAEIATYQKPVLVAQKYEPLLTSRLTEDQKACVQAHHFESVSEWGAYIKLHFIRGLSGTLKKINVFQLIQLMSQASTTGCILLKDLVKQREGMLYFVQGKLVEATLNDATGECAFFESMRIRMGIFQQVSFQEPPSRQLENFSVTRLLMNVSRPPEFEDLFVEKIDGLISA